MSIFPWAWVGKGAKGPLKVHWLLCALAKRRKCRARKLYCTHSCALRPLYPIRNGRTFSTRTAYRPLSQSVRGLLSSEALSLHLAVRACVTLSLLLIPHPLHLDPPQETSDLMAAQDDSLVTIDTRHRPDLATARPGTFDLAAPMLPTDRRGRPRGAPARPVALRDVDADLALARGLPNLEALLREQELEERNATTTPAAAVSAKGGKAPSSETDDDRAMAIETTPAALTSTAAPVASTTAPSPSPAAGPATAASATSGPRKEEKDAAVVAPWRREAVDPHWRPPPRDDEEQEPWRPPAGPRKCPSSLLFAGSYLWWLGWL